MWKNVLGNTSNYYDWSDLVQPESDVKSFHNQFFCMKCKNAEGIGQIEKKTLYI